MRVEKGRAFAYEDAGLVSPFSKIALALCLAVPFFCQTFFASVLSRSLAIGASILLLLISSARREGRIFLGGSSALFGCLFFLIIVNKNADLLGGSGLMWTVLFPCYIFIGALLNSVERSAWIGFFTKLVAIFAFIHAVITITCWIDPNFRLRFIHQVFFPSMNGALDYKRGFTSHYSTNGIYLAYGLIAVASLLQQKKTASRIVELVVLSFALLLTAKRAHTVFVVISILFVYLVSNRGKTTEAVYRTGMIALFAVAAIYVASQYVPEITRVVERLQDVADDDTFGSRSEYYKICARMWRSRPLLGNGWGSYTREFNTTPLGVFYTSMGSMQMNAHNVYLQMMAEEGLVGLFLLVAGIIAAVKTGLRAFGIDRDADAREHDADQYLGFCLMIVLFFMLYCITGNPFYDIQTYSVSLLGIAGVEQVSRERELLRELSTK